MVLPLVEFVEKCRGSRDHNGRNLPPLAPAAAQSLAAAVPKRNWGTGRKLTPERAALYEAVLADFARGMRECDAARKHGVNVFSFNTWRRRQENLPERLAEYRRTAPVTKPNGKLL